MSLNAPPTRRSKCPRAVVFIDESGMSFAMASFAYWVIRQEAAPAKKWASGGRPAFVPPLSGGSSIVKLNCPNEAWRRNCSTSSISTLCDPNSGAWRTRRSAFSFLTTAIRSENAFKATATRPQDECLSRRSFRLGVGSARP